MIGRLDCFGACRAVAWTTIAFVIFSCGGQGVPADQYYMPNSRVACSGKGGSKTPESAKTSNDLDDIRIIEIRNEQDEELLNDSVEALRIIDASDSQLSRICPKVPQLRVIDIRGSGVLTSAPCRITDEGLQSLKSLRLLQRLTISLAPNITDGGMEILRECPMLAVLSLRGCKQLSGRTFLQLRDVGKLEVLDASGWLKKIGDDHLRYLHAATQLRELYMSASFEGTGAALALLLSNLRQLRTLHVAYCFGVDDHTVKTLAQLPDVQNLVVASSDITDSSLLSLVNAAKLRFLNVQKCDGVTYEALELFARQRPDVKVEK